MAGTMKRWLTWLLSRVLAASLVVGVAFAGTGHSAGWHKDSGNKWGNENKNATWDCPDGYTLEAAGGFTAYDLNGNGQICAGSVDGWINYMDDQRAND